eukprot:TRINITY_DN6507_c3_g1_i1.p1 TRINITY_DN6507_c3_g1~~TRINITY_DN6507_c3_g1_i1.p1  ORF type:complete len:475 (-),score=204.96 TRINITY_DN6507_c3_g1_i1:23-1390(-)
MVTTRFLKNFCKNPTNIIKSFAKNENLNLNLVRSFEVKTPFRLEKFGPSVWLEFTPLANSSGAVNLGQGFPDFSPPDFALSALSNQSLLTTTPLLHQYARSGGHLRLTQVLSKLYSNQIDRTLDPLKEIVITVGASEGIFTSLQALVDPGDEVILFEPYFDIYEAGIVMAGGVPRYVPLKPTKNLNGEKLAADWKVDLAELKAVINSKTKVLLINNPYNPLGKVFTKQELLEISEIVRQHDKLVVISDEVYEWMVYDNIKHERFCTLPDMWERTITISSAGKTFSCTGWKIGWCYGPSNLIANIMCAHQYIPFSVATPLQEAIAISFEKAIESNYFDEFKAMYQEKRDILVSILQEAGLEPYKPQGTFFVLADTQNVKLPKEFDSEKVSITKQFLDAQDWNVCRYITTEIGVAVLPVSAFCNSNTQLPKSLIRLAFCKQNSILNEAGKRFQKFKN